LKNRLKNQKKQTIKGRIFEWQNIEKTDKELSKFFV